MDASKKTLRDITLVSLITLAILATIYLPFALHLKNVWGIPLAESGMAQIFANWDGPNYLYNALTGYNPRLMEKLPFDGKPPLYYAAHLPGYSLLIALVKPVLGLLWGGLFINIVSNLILNTSFYFFIRKQTKHALWLTIAFTIFPARFLTVRSVISAEMLMIACVIGVLGFWRANKTLLAAVCLFIGIWIKFQMVLFLPAFALVWIADTITHRRFAVKPFFMGLVGMVALMSVFAWYAYSLGRWDAYFAAQRFSGLQASLPLGMFNYANKWVATGWTEHTVLYLVGIVMMLINMRPLVQRLSFAFAASYFGFLLVTPHMDIMRYSMPLAPLFFATFSEVFEKRWFRYGLLASLPMIYLSVINFIMNNRAPIGDWSIFIR